MKVEYRFEDWYFNNVLTKSSRDTFNSLPYNEQQRRLKVVDLHFQTRGELVFYNDNKGNIKRVTINPVRFSVKTIIESQKTINVRGLKDTFQRFPYLKTAFEDYDVEPTDDYKKSLAKRIEEGQERLRQAIQDKKARSISINKYGATKDDVVKIKIERKEVQPFKVHYYLTSKFFKTLSLKEKLEYTDMMKTKPKRYQNQLENMYNEKHFTGGNPVGISFTGDKKSYRMDEVYKLCFTKDEQETHKRLSHTHTYYRHEDSSHVINDIRKVERRYHFTMSDHRCLYGHKYN